MKHRVQMACVFTAGCLSLVACGTTDDKPISTATTATAAADTRTDTSSQPETAGGRDDSSRTSQTTVETDDTVPEGVISIRTDEDSQLGTILVDNEGIALYMHTKDGTNSSSCTGACAASWIPVTGTSIEVADDLDEGKFELFSRGDGEQQVSFNGHPLYRFSSDKRAGQTNGQGVNYQWYVAGADGNPVNPNQ